MSKYEMAVRVSQVQSLVEERKYRKAAAVLSTIDVRQVKSQTELQTFAEVYVKTEQFEAAKAIYLRIYKRNHNKKVLYRLIYPLRRQRQMCIRDRMRRSVFMRSFRI